MAIRKSKRLNQDAQNQLEAIADKADSPVVEIMQTKHVKKSKNKLTPDTDMHPLAPHKYKSLTLPFNRYNFERLEEYCEETRESKYSVMRQALEEFLNK